MKHMKKNKEKILMIFKFTWKKDLITSVIFHLYQPILRITITQLVIKFGQTILNILYRSCLIFRLNLVHDMLIWDSIKFLWRNLSSICGKLFRESFRIIRTLDFQKLWKTLFHKFSSMILLKVLILFYK